MAIFEYTAMREGGEAVTGTLDAESARRAREHLREHGLYVTRMCEAGGDRQGGLFGLLRRRRPQRVLWFTRQLHLLVLTGMPLREALSSLAGSCPASLRPVVVGLRDDISKGDTLAAAMERRGGWFDPLYVSMVRAGERSGELAELLGTITDYMQSKEDWRRQMRAALLYPKLVAVTAFGVVVFLMSAVVPRFIEVIAQRGGQLPWPTRALRSASGLFGAHWPLILAGLVALWGGWRLLLTRSALRLALAGWTLRLPAVGELRRKQLAQRFAVMLGALLRGGIVLTDALRQIADGAEDPLLKREAERIRLNVEEGGRLDSLSRGTAVFPPSFADMLSAGQESGSLIPVLGTAARAYREDVEAATTKVAALTEPAAILAVALVVAFIVAAVLLPVFELSKLQ